MKFSIYLNRHVFVMNVDKSFDANRRFSQKLKPEWQTDSDKTVRYELSGSTFTVYKYMYLFWSAGLKELNYQIKITDIFIFHRNYIIESSPCTSLCFPLTSQKHTYIILTPLNPTFV